MKRFIISGSTAVAALMTIGAPLAFADVSVTALIVKTKDISVAENISITKQVDIQASVSLAATKTAEGDTIVNQTNTNNQACANCEEKFDLISGSIDNNSLGAAISVNQAAGNMNNQANAVTAVVDNFGVVPPNNTPPPTTSGGYAEAQAAVDQRMGVTKDVEGVESPSPNLIETVNVLFREADIDGSINNNLGIVDVNQASGNMNNQANTLTLALSLEDGVALSEADLGQANANNETHEASVFKSALMNGSVLNNRGIVGVNQTVGNFANQANVVAAAAAIQVSAP